MFLCRAKTLGIARHIRNMSSGKQLILYGDEASPPVRFAMMTAALLKVDYEFHLIDLFKGEHKTQFYKKINPLQKVPALSINGEVICDSHAIALYFCRISKCNKLYPEEAVLRSKIDEMMYYNSSVLFPIDSAIYTGFFAGKWPVDEVTINKWFAALDYLEFRLNKQEFLTDNEVRLCDYCCGATISSLEILIPLSERHQKVKNWFTKLNLNNFDINPRGIHRLQGFVDAVRSQNIEKKYFF